MDATLDTAIESYNGLSSYSHCGKHAVYSFFAETPGDIAYDPEEVDIPNSRETFDIHFHYDSWSQGGCFGHTITVRDMYFEVWVTDSSGVVDWIAAKDHVIKDGYSGGSGEVTWGIDVGGELAGASAGFSATFSAPDTPTFPRSTSNSDLGGGTKYFGWHGVKWPTNSQVSFDAMWPIFVYNGPAQYRLWDQVTFKIRLTVYWDTHSFLGWHYNQAPETFEFVLGDGTFNRENLNDQYTNVQRGYMDGPEG